MKWTMLKLQLPSLWTSQSLVIQDYRDTTVSRFLRYKYPSPKQLLQQHTSSSSKLTKTTRSLTKSRAKLAGALIAPRKKSAQQTMELTVRRSPTWTPATPEQEYAGMILWWNIHCSSAYRLSMWPLVPGPDGEGVPMD